MSEFQSVQIPCFFLAAAGAGEEKIETRQRIAVVDGLTEARNPIDKSKIFSCVVVLRD